jgi:hypothetical protein
MFTKSIRTRPFLKWMLMTALLTGCSSASLVYNNADWLVRGKIDDYFSLSGPQKQQLKSNINSILQWHRQQELVKYSDLLNQFTQQYANGLNSEELDLFFDKVTLARIRLVEASIPAASQLLSTVSIKQIDYYDKVLLEKSVKRAKELDTPPKEYAKENFTRLIENMEDWFGDFDKIQIKKLQIISDARPDNRQFWFDQNKLRHKRFSDLLRSHPSKEIIEQYLYDRFAALERTDAQEQSMSRQVRLYWMSTLLSIDKIITTKQRQHLISRLTDYSIDFLALSKKSSKSLKDRVQR